MDSSNYTHIDKKLWNKINEKLEQIEKLQTDMYGLKPDENEDEFDSLSDISLVTNSITTSENIKDIKSPHSEYMTPTPLRISTMTAVCNLVSKKDSLDSKNSISIDLSLYSINVPIDEVNGPIIGVKFGKLPIRGYNKNKNKKKISKQKNFFNQSTILVCLNSFLPNKVKQRRIINVKVFLNGGIQMTGLKNEEEGRICIEKIIIPSLLSVKGLKEDILVNVIDTHTELYCHNYRIVLINSDFKLGFKLKREVLFHILTTKYKIFAIYEPCVYPGINSKYFWNKTYKDIINDNPDSFKKCDWNDSSIEEGVCYCSEVCNGKGLGNGNGECKKVTISIFQSGSIIITGARSVEQVNDAYKFINKIFMTEFVHIRKKPLKLLKLLEKTPKNRKIIFIKKSKIKRIKRIKKT